MALKFCLEARNPLRYTPQALEHLFTLFDNRRITATFRLDHLMALESWSHIVLGDCKGVLG